MDLNDMINFRLERQEEEQLESESRLKQVFCRLATITGQADYALAHAGDDLAGMRGAFEVLRNQIVGLLRENDVELVGKAGDVIDPYRHTVEEVRMEPTADLPRIAEIIDYGAICSRDERLLQRARVVATIPASSQET